MDEITSDVDDERVEQLLENTTVEVEGDTETLSDLLRDIQVAHGELDDYKRGALKLSQSLDERKMVAEDQGDTELVEILEDIKSAGFGVYLRLQRGDLELLGERDGKHSGYFAEE